jgi:hypothetical protein
MVKSTHKWRLIILKSNFYQKDCRIEEMIKFQMKWSPRFFSGQKSKEEEEEQMMMVVSSRLFESASIQRTLN